MDTLKKERICACTINRIFGYEPACSSRLVTELGSASAVFEMDRSELDRIISPSSKYYGLLNDTALEESEKELDRLEREGYRFISRCEDGFPMLLRECEDCPAGLYINGVSEPAEIFNSGPAVAVIGTRDISPYGEEWVPKIVRSISEARVRASIVSGLAFGVDISAHMAALSFGLPTIAVLPVGIDMVYPYSHRAAARKIAESKGSALVTDYPPGTCAKALNFLRRNRIIAGLSNATILAESRLKGGGMMTARLASGYGRDVFALPGRLGDSRSEGCNALIGEKVAEAIVSMEALPASLGLGRFVRSLQKDLEAEIRKRFSGQDTDRLCTVAGLIRVHRGISADGISEESGLDYSDVAAAISLLETEGFIDVDLLQRCSIHSFFT